MHNPARAGFSEYLTGRRLVVGVPKVEPVCLREHDPVVQLRKLYAHLPYTHVIFTSFEETVAACAPSVDPLPSLELHGDTADEDEDADGESSVPLPVPTKTPVPVPLLTLESFSLEHDVPLNAWRPAVSRLVAYAEAGRALDAAALADSLASVLQSTRAGLVALRRLLFTPWNLVTLEDVTAAGPPTPAAAGEAEQAPRPVCSISELSGNVRDVLRLIAGAAPNTHSDGWSAALNYWGVEDASHPALDSFMETIDNATAAAAKAAAVAVAISSESEGSAPDDSDVQTALVAADEARTVVEAMTWHVAVFAGVPGEGVSVARNAYPRLLSQLAALKTEILTRASNLASEQIEAELTRFSARGSVLHPEAAQTTEAPSEADPVATAFAELNQGVIDDLRGL